MFKKPSKKMLDVIIYSCVSIFILVLLHVFLGVSIIKYSNRVKEEFKQKEAKVRELEALIKGLPDPQKAIEEVEKKAGEFRDMGLSRKQLPRLIQLLGFSTSERNINLISLKPREDIRTINESLPTGVSKVYIEMVISGSYQSLGEYLKVLSGLPTSFSIEAMSIEKKETNAELQDTRRAFEKTETKAEAEGLLCTLLLSAYMVWEI